MADIRAKALSCLRDGRVAVLRARTNRGEVRPYEVVAMVTSSRGEHIRYCVDLTAGIGWWCTCEKNRECVHAAAVQLVTGWPTEARKEPK